MASNPNKIQGAILATGINGEVTTCQISAEFAWQANTNEVPPCKPMEGDAYNAANPSKFEISGSNWTISFSSRAYAESTGYNQGDILEAIAAGNLLCPIIFGTTPTSNYDKQETQTITGEAWLTGFTWSGPETGDSTYDVTLQGEGDFAFVRVPYTT